MSATRLVLPESPCSRQGQLSRWISVATRFAAPALALACLLAPQSAQAIVPIPTTTQLTITNSHSVHVTSVSYTTPAPGNLINLNAVVRIIPTGTVQNGVVVFCDGGTVANCLDGHFIGAAEIMPHLSLSGFGAVITIAPTLGTHNYRAVYLGFDFAPFASSTSASVLFHVVGPPPLPAFVPTSTAASSSGAPGNYTVNATVDATTAGNGWGVGYTNITGHVDFLDANNSNFNFGPASVGPTTFTSGFVPLALPPQPPTFSAVLGAAANLKTGFPNTPGPGPFNDGSPDLIFVATNPSGPGYVIETFLNQLQNGGASFPAPPNVISMPGPVNTDNANPLAMVTGDFNSDGNIDLVISFDDGSVWFFPGIGFGVFNSPVQIQGAGGLLQYSLYAADLGHTGLQSVFGYSSLGYTIFPGSPTGPLSGVVSAYPGWDWGGAIVAADFADLNGDLVSFVVSNPDTANITEFLPNGPLPSTNFTLYGSAPVGNGPSAMAVGDFNGDGHLDLAVVNSTDGTITILLGDGHGNLPPFATFPVGFDPTSIAVGDVNGDGIPDLIVGNSGDGTISVLLGDGSGNFAPSPASPLASTSNFDYLYGVVAADFNEDLFTDVEAVNNLLPGLFIGTLSAQTTASVSGVAVAGSGTHSIHANYSGDNTYEPSTGSVGLTAEPLTTNLLLTASPSSPSTWGTPVMLTAMLSPFSAQGHTTNGETVAFFDGVTPLGPGTLSGGVATLTIASPSVGTHHYNAAYAGDPYFAPAPSLVVPYTVNKAASSTLLSIATTPLVVGTPDLLTATVTGFHAPRGNVIFRVNGNPICTVPLDATGHATCSLLTWSTSPDTVVAEYLGDIDFLSSTSNTLHLTPVAVFNSNVVLTVDNIFLTYPGQTQTVTCIHHGFFTPTGIVKIYDDVTPIQTLTVGGDGCAYWYITPGLHAGIHHLRAWYSGDLHHPGGFSVVTLVFVHQLATYWSIQCPQNIHHGQNEVCSIAIWSNVGPPHGSIFYSYDGGPQLSTAITGGNATVIIPTPHFGNHSIVFTCPGTNDLAPLGPESHSFNVSF